MNEKLKNIATIKISIELTMRIVRELPLLIS